MTSISTTFTSVNEKLFLNACELGRNEVLSLLIIAMGTTGVSTYTKWSADVISKRLKIDWRYAKAAIDNLKKAEIIVDMNAEANKGKKRARPSYKMNEITNNRLWYPASLFDEFVIDPKFPKITK